MDQETKRMHLNKDTVCKKIRRGQTLCMQSETPGRFNHTRARLPAKPSATAGVCATDRSANTDTPSSNSAEER